MFLVVLIFQMTARSQTLAPATPADAVPEATRKAASELLPLLANEAGQLVRPENRLAAVIQIAELLWPHNEKEARLMFDGAYSELRNMIAAAAVPAGTELKTSDRARIFGHRQTLADLRAELVLALASFDPKSALDALAGLRTNLIEDYDPLRTDELELKITERLAKNNPDESYAVARKQLETNGINYQFVEALRNLHKKDSKLSAALGRDIVEKVRSAKIRVPSANGPGTAKKANGEIDFWELSSFISAASQMNRISAADKTKKMQPLVGEAEMKELVTTLAAAFLAEPEPASFAINQSLPEITRHAPLLAQRIRKKLGATVSAQLDRVTESNSYYYQADEKSADDLARMADVSAPEFRDSRYSFAAAKALENNDPEKAQAIAARIKDRKSYSYLLDQIDAALPLAKARRGDLEAVRGMLASLRTNQERVGALTELASALAAKGDKVAAKTLLDESRQMMSAYVRRFPDLHSAVKVSAVYAVAAPDEAFSLVESGISQMNDYIFAGIKIDDFYDGNSDEIDELQFSSISRQMLLHVPNSAALMKNLAISDFDRTLRLADGFQKPEIRFFVRLRIAEAVLDKNASEKERSRLDQVAGDDETE
jgi:hypothetical protein